MRASRDLSGSLRQPTNIGVWFRWSVRTPAAAFGPPLCTHRLTRADWSVTMAPMLTIRLQRRGRKNDPSFRVLVLDSKQGPKTGKYLEMVGSYDARTNRVELQGERIKHWMSNGAQVSDTVHNLLISNGIIEGKKRNVLPKKTVAKVEAPVVEETPAATTEETASVAEAPAESPVAEEAPAVEVAEDTKPA